MVQIERRKVRSNVRSEAVSLFLEHNAARAGVRAVVLSDMSGFLIGGTGDIDQTVLAAIGPLFVTGSSPSLSDQTEALVEDVVKNHDLYASRVQLDDRTLILTSIGGRFPEHRRAERAFQRILAS
ncbi:MAG: hypothetical protein R3F14_25335 [Polyangiaceae bacterium]